MTILIVGNTCNFHLERQKYNNKVMLELQCYQKLVSESSTIFLQYFVLSHLVSSRSIMKPFDLNVEHFYNFCNHIQIISSSWNCDLGT